MESEGSAEDKHNLMNTPMNTPMNTLNTSYNIHNNTMNNNTMNNNTMNNNTMNNNTMLTRQVSIQSNISRIFEDPIMITDGLF